MTYDSYPPGMSHNDLIYVGEITDPYNKFYEDYEPTDEQMGEFLSENMEEFLADFSIGKPWNKTGVTWSNLCDWYKDENSAEVESEYERWRND